jgi:hypothetical protein
MMLRLGMLDGGALRLQCGAGAPRVDGRRHQQDQLESAIAGELAHEQGLLAGVLRASGQHQMLGRHPGRIHELARDARAVDPGGLGQDQVLRLPAGDEVDTVEEPVADLAEALGAGAKAGERDEHRIGGLDDLAAGEAPAEPGGDRRERDQAPEGGEAERGQRHQAPEAGRRGERPHHRGRHHQGLALAIVGDERRQVEVADEEAGEGAEGQARRDGRPSPERPARHRRAGHGGFGGRGKERE